MWSVPLGLTVWQYEKAFNLGVIGAGVAVTKTEKEQPWRFFREGRKENALARRGLFGCAAARAWRVLYKKNHFVCVRARAWLRLAAFFCLLLPSSSTSSFYWQVAAMGAVEGSPVGMSIQLLGIIVEAARLALVQLLLQVSAPFFSFPASLTLFSLSSSSSSSFLFFLFIAHSLSFVSLSYLFHFFFMGSFCFVASAAASSFRPSRPCTSSRRPSCPSSSPSHSPRERFGYRFNYHTRLCCSFAPIVYSLLMGSIHKTRLVYSLFPGRGGAVENLKLAKRKSATSVEYEKRSLCPRCQRSSRRAGTSRSG